jgi:hypothetical protein
VEVKETINRAGSLPVEIESVIDRLSEAQLCQLQNRVVDRIKAFRELNALKAKSTLFVGDQVRFDYEQVSYFGVITKKNRVTISVRTQDQKNWNISPHLLTKLHSAS